MRKIKAKLNNSSGASLLFSMVLFLVVCMVSVTILTAAVTSLKRTHQNKQNLQTSLALESAAMLIRDELDGCKYTITTILKNEDGEFVPEAPSETAPNPSETIPTNEFAAIIVDAVKEVRNGSVSFESFSLSTNKVEIPDVTVEYAMNKNNEEARQETQNQQYQMIFTLQADDNREKIFLTFDVTYVKKEVSLTEDGTEIDGTGTQIDKIKQIETYTWQFYKMSGMAGGAT